MLKIQLENDRSLFAPGEELRGVAEWELSETPKTADLKLIWYTMGIGTQDVAVLEELSLPFAPSHREEFSFSLPESPYSFTGIHITLQWAVELSVNKGKDSARADFTLSPWGELIRLGQVPDK